jgi:hypothetical protein
LTHPDFAALVTPLYCVEKGKMKRKEETLQLPSVRSREGKNEKKRENAAAPFSTT